MSVMSEGTLAEVLAGSATWCVIEGDCLEVLPTIPDKAVAHVITDPPYHPRAMKNARSNGEVMKERRDGIIYDFGYSALSADTRLSVSLQFARIAKRWVVVWTDIEGDHLWRADMELGGLEYIRLGLWHRTNSAPQFSGDRPAHCVEACVIMHPKGRKRWNGGGLPAFWSMAVVDHNDDSRFHATPKPLQLMLSQVEMFTTPADLVLDAFSGSGTTGVACLRSGRRYVGIERDPAYAAASRERLRAEANGLSLRDARAGQLPMFGAP